MSPFDPVPSRDRLLTLIDAMEDQPVLMVVDLVIDRFITGTPKRISREAPVLILRWEGDTTTPGGGANAVANVAALGGRPLPLGIVGRDDAGRALREHFATLGVDDRGILDRDDYRTPTKTRILGGARHALKQQIVRYDIEDHLQLDDADRDRMLAPLVTWPTPRAAVLSDYGYGTVDPAFVPALRQRLDTDVPVLGDSRYRLADFRGLDGATPNAEEAETLLGLPLADDDRTGLEAGGRRLRERLDARFLLITRGSAGMSLISTDGRAHHIPVHGNDQVADVTGAGDTVIGTFALALAAGGSPLEAACLANYAGGVVVMKMGTATLDRDELRSAVRRDDRPLDALAD
ncbi:MAG: PfkB family carbohydrate kinase [Acidobacteriota bacterium]